MNITTQKDEFARDVWCIYGLPFDRVNLPEAKQIVYAACQSENQLFLSTPNLNFAISAKSNPAFRDSVIYSDLSLIDGMPLIWVARCLGLPFSERVAGSDLMFALNQDISTQPISLFFFGGKSGVAEKANEVLLHNPGNLRGIGNYYPGFGSVEDMSGDGIMATINLCNPDFVVVALGAKKGQEWILQNRHRLNCRVIGHLGAVVNFFAGTVKRAPVLMQRYGLEWIWRITEEPELWRRYFWDGLVFLWLFMSRVLPYALWLRISPYKNKKLPEPKCQLMEFPNHVDIKITGACRHDVLNNIRAIFREAASLNKECFLDLSDCDYIDSSFIGCVFLLKKALINKAVKLIKTKKIIEQILYWNCAEFIYKNK